MCDESFFSVLDILSKYVIYEILIIMFRYSINISKEVNLDVKFMGGDYVILL